QRGHTLGVSWWRAGGVLQAEETGASGGERNSFGAFKIAAGSCAWWDECEIQGRGGGGKSGVRDVQGCANQVCDLIEVIRGPAVGSESVNGKTERRCNLNDGAGICSDRE